MVIKIPKEQKLWKHSNTDDLDITMHGGVSCEGGFLLAHNLTFPLIACVIPISLMDEGSKDP